MEGLIEQVRSRPCLWDVEHAGYKDFEQMERAWAQVAEATGFHNAKTAKLQWKKLRDNFREALKRQKDAKGSGRMWRYQQQMEFLTPFMTSKSHDFSSTVESCSDSNGELHLYPLDDAKCEDGDCEVPQRKRRKASSIADDLAKDLSEPLGGPRIQPGNPLLDFFSSMYNTTEELPLHLQLQVKRKVFEVVMAAEEAALMLQQQQQQEYDATYFM